MLDSGAKTVTTQTKLKAAKALADLVEDPTPDCIVPSVFDERVAPAVAAAVSAVPPA
jgi:malate dehydrogenase (oxaloacetate-decarboxylating)